MTRVRVGFGMLVAGAHDNFAAYIRRENFFYRMFGSAISFMTE